MSDAHAHAAEKYYVPTTSKWPIIASASFFTLLFGAVALLNHWAPACGWMCAGLRAGGVHVHRLVRRPSSAKTSRASTASMSTARSAWE